MDYSIAYKNIERLVKLSDDDKEVFESLFKADTVKKNQIILEKGQVCKFEYFILKGCLRSRSETAF